MWPPSHRISANSENSIRKLSATSRARGARGVPSLTFVPPATSDTAAERTRHGPPETDWQPVQPTPVASWQSEGSYGTSSASPG
jgi:hypothetical protein